MFPTASSHERATRCVGPALIPLRHKHTSEAAEQGTKDHAVYLPSMAGLAPFPDTPRGDFLRRRVDVVPGDIEISVAIEPKSMRARVLGQGLERDYSSCPADWIAMTLDHYATDRPYIAELKTGGAPQKQPYENAQIRTQALAVWLLHDMVLPEVRLVHVSAAGKGWAPWWAPGRRRPTAGEMWAWRRVLINMVDAIEAQRGRKPDELELVTGQHCTYCDQRRARACPAIEPWLSASPTDALDADAQAQVAMQEARERREAADMLLGDDERVAGKLIFRRRVHASKAIETMPELEEYAQPSISVAALDAFIGEHREANEPWRDARDRIEQALEEAGALTYTSSTKLILPRDDHAAKNV